MASLRLVLALSAIYSFEVHQMDVETAFLNADLDEVYIRAPEGYTMPAGCNCIRLKKGLYGLKQTPRAWNRDINMKLHGMGFHQLQSEPCLYLHYKDHDICIISLYVDDLVIAASSLGVINHVKTKLQQHYLMKDLGVIDEILGCKVCVDRDLDSITIHQAQYMKEILKRFLPDDNVTHLAPADPTGHLVNDQCAKSDEDREFMRDIPYRQAVGSLLWLALCTQPDISYAVGQVAKFNANPGPDQWKTVLRIFRYLKFTGPMGTVYRYSMSNVDNQLVMVMFRSANDLGGLGNPVLSGYSDANFARDIDTRRSTSGFIFMLAGAPISWQSRAQATVALSSTEAEYIALAGAAQEAVCFLQVLREFKFAITAKKYEDNQSTIKLVENPVLHQKSKDVDIKYHFVRELVENRVLEVQHVSTVENIADLFTKPLSFKEFTTLRAAFLSYVT